MLIVIKDGAFKYRGIFKKVMAMEKGKDYWKLKKNVGSHAFSEIIKHSNSTKKKYKDCIAMFFQI